MKTLCYSTGLADKMHILILFSFVASLHLLFFKFKKHCKANKCDLCLSTNYLSELCSGNSASGVNVTGEQRVNQTYKIMPENVFKLSCTKQLM